MFVFLLSCEFLAGLELTKDLPACLPKYLIKERCATPSPAENSNIFPHLSEAWFSPLKSLTGERLLATKQLLPVVAQMGGLGRESGRLANRHSTIT